jgi:hypothetical protein
VRPQDPLFDAIRKLNAKVISKKKTRMFSYWEVKRTYTEAELRTAELFRFTITTAFEPVGEECGTEYDEEAACDICGAHRKQLGPLRLQRSSIPRKDIARTIAGEVVVSEQFVNCTRQRGLRGVSFEPVQFRGRGSRSYYQPIIISPSLELSDKTIVGNNVFDLSGETVEEQEIEVPGGNTFTFERLVRKCPRGHTLGLRLISEAFVRACDTITKFDMFISRQLISAKHGVLRPEPVYFCSPRFHRMVAEEKLKGFEFEIARVVE